MAGKPDLSAKNDLDCIRIFKKAGFKDLQPRVNILTFRKWTEQKRRPVEKSKAYRINNLRLWHFDQTRPMTAAEIKAAKEQPEAAANRKAKGGKVIPINAKPDTSTDIPF